MITPEDFASKIRAKFPGAYDSVDDKTLTSKFIEKYPTYGSQVIGFGDKAKESEYPGNPTGAGKLIRDVTKPIARVGESIANTIQVAGGQTPTDLESKYWGHVERIGKNFDITKGFTPENLNALKDAAENGVDIASLLPADLLAKAGWEGAIGAGKSLVKGVAEKGGKILTDIAERNVNPFAKSAFKTGGEEAAAKYEDLYKSASEIKAGNSKIDSPLEKVGSEIGDQFKSVVEKRREVGKLMGDELNKVKDVPVDISPHIDSFGQDLAGSGIKDQGGVLKLAGKQSRMTSEDLKMLQNYSLELRDLGSKPTASELAAFRERIPKEMDLYKAKNSIMGTTNGERIIQSNLRDLGTSFDHTGEFGNPAFENYNKARQMYSELSKFVKEGTGHLGKITQTGDFAKDASVAKSAVQSILNSGKKDWLMKLEKLTGYPALDNSSIAIQAMKDAGDYKGMSLLEHFGTDAHSSIPTSRAGVVRWLAKYGKNKVVGDSAEQTRRYISSILNKAK